MKKIDEFYSSSNIVEDIFTSNHNNNYDWREELHSEDLNEEHIQKIIRAILKQAIFENVHEVYFEFIENGLGVNFKLNSDVLNRGYIPSVLAASFIAKLKILSDLDPSVSEVPQLGKLCFKVDNTNLIASISAFPTILGERISLKIYKPPMKLNKIIQEESRLNSIKTALTNPGIILVCGSSLSGKTHLIYSLLTEIASENKNIMTIESIAKYNLENVNQCELNENIGFNLDKALRFIEFQSPDIIYLEGVKTKEAFDYFSSLVFNDKIVITEFLANNMADLRKKLAFADFDIFKSLISCLIFIHTPESVEVFDKSNIQKFLGAGIA